MINELNMVAVKQYLENSWYRWASQDRQTWYAAQYQYGYGVNTRDMKNWVCLAWWKEELNTFSTWINVFTAFWDLYYINGNWGIYDINNNSKCQTLVTDQYAPICVEFWNSVFVIWDNAVKYVTTWWTVNDITNVFPTYHGAWYRWKWYCALNYANTFLLIWDGNVLWRIDGALWTIKGIRYFNSWYEIYWLTQEWNYLKIYTSNGCDTKIHYCKGTFDVEETWLVQTISYPWLAIGIWDVTSDQWRDYVIFRQSDRHVSSAASYRLAKVQWYNKIDIRWTQTRWNMTVFWASNPTIYASDWVVFAGMAEWIRTFTEYNWWLWWWCVEFPTTGITTSMVKYWEKLYWVEQLGSTYKLYSYDMSFHPATYQQTWYIIGRVFDWWCAWLFKKNVQTTVTYNMPSWTSMELSYRYDRSSFNYWADNFLSIKELTDTNSCYDIVVPTTDSNFNRTWNLLEYRVDLWSNTEKTSTPILFEHNLLYNDAIRKYR